MATMKLDSPRRGPGVRHAGQEACWRCGNGVNPDTAPAWVHVVDGGASISDSAAVDDEASDMGYFPIGPDCVKHVPLAFRHTMPKAASLPLDSLDAIANLARAERDAALREAASEAERADRAERRYVRLRDAVRGLAFMVGADDE